MLFPGGSRDLRGVQGAGEEADRGQHEHLQHLQDRAHHRPQPRTGEDLPLSLRLQVATATSLGPASNNLCQIVLYISTKCIFYSILFYV